MHKDALAQLSKARKLNPGSETVWQEMLLVFESMGDYSSAEKAYHNGAILGLYYDHDVFTEQGKTTPGQKEEDPLWYYFTKMSFERDFGGIIDMLDTSKMVDPSNIAWIKIQAYYGLDIQDSVKHYGQFLLDHTDGHLLFTHAYLGNKEKVKRIVQEQLKLSPAGGVNLLNYCLLKVNEIRVLAILGEYGQATEILIKLNREYPNYGRYGLLFHDPNMDKIKLESKPFVKALNNLKLPPKLDLEGLIKL